MSLATAISLADKARSDFVARCLDVWHLVELAEPVLATELRQLGFDDAAAAAWLCTPIGEAEQTPAKFVEAGRSAEMLERIRRMMHGICG